VYILVELHQTINSLGDTARALQSARNTGMHQTICMRLSGLVVTMSHSRPGHGVGDQIRVLFGGGASSSSMCPSRDPQSAWSSSWSR
jgi:hypothetical protein